MTTTLKAFLVLAICIVKPALAQTQTATIQGRYVEWVVAFDTSPTDLHYAAIGTGLFPVVVTQHFATGKFFRENPGIPPGVLRFSLLRQDAVAYLVADALRSRDEYRQAFGVPQWSSKTKTRPFAPIPERDVYDHAKLRGRGGDALDCIAFHGLSADFQRELRLAVLRAEKTGQRLPVPPTQRLLTTQTLSFSESDECQVLAREFE